MVARRTTMRSNGCQEGPVRLRHGPWRNPAPVDNAAGER
jgi:hypothetical protein